MREIEKGATISSGATKSPAGIRVVSWNIARGSRLDGIMEFLISADADIIFLQETDRNARRTGHRNVAKEIAQRLRMNYVFGCEFEELAQGTPESPAFHGQATLSRWPISDCSVLRFHNQSNFWRPRWFIPSIPPLQRRRGGRMALFSNVLILGRSLPTYNLHCESKGGNDLRYSQLQEFLQDAKRYNSDVPVLAAGDFNFDLSHGHAAAALESAGFLNPFITLHKATTTSHALSAGDRVIDWILFRGSLLVTNAQVYDSISASDHYPLSLTASFL